MRQTTLPPEMLPSTGDEVEIIVCQGPPRCGGQVEAPCPFCIRVGGGVSVNDILAKLNDVQ